MTKPKPTTKPSARKLGGSVGGSTFEVGERGPEVFTPPVDTRDADRQAELGRQAAVEAAVHDATHDEHGDPLPLPRPDGITIVEGRP